MLENIEPLITWIQSNPTFSGFIVFFISLSESLVGVGLIVPGLAMMTAIGALIGAGILPMFLTMLWAILGAIAGDGASYWLGHHYHEKLREIWPFNRFPGLLGRGEKFFKEHGGMSVVLGRFIGPIRPIIPVIAGMMDMTPPRFLVFNIISAIVWAPIYCLPGILIGASLGALSKADASKFGFFVLIAILGVWFLYLFLMTIIYRLLARSNRLLDAIWYWWGKSNKLASIRRMLQVKGSQSGQLGLGIGSKVLPMSLIGWKNIVIILALF